jgi:hypothetical protein
MDRHIQSTLSRLRDRVDDVYQKNVPSMGEEALA